MSFQVTPNETFATIDNASEDKPVFGGHAWGSTFSSYSIQVTNKNTFKNIFSLIVN